MIPLKKTSYFPDMHLFIFSTYQTCNEMKGDIVHLKQKSDGMKQIT